jgi:C-terminal processing protease CtpA/Prc
VKPELLVANLQGVGYLMIGAWDSSQFGVSDIDTAISQAQSFPALIVDVRPNSGGDSSLAFALAQRFITRPLITGYFQTKSGPGHSDFNVAAPNTISPRGPWQYTKPVILLVGKGTLSSSESFVSAMRELPNVIVAGDTTGGSSGNPKTYSLTSGWSYTVSSWIEYTAKNEIIEDKGIQPQVLIPSTDADFAVGIDPVFDWAIAKAKSL